MARDFEDIHDLEDLNGDELKSLVREHLEAHDGIDADEITVQVDHGTVILGGTVGTDGERLIAERVVTDVLGIEKVQNDIYVDAAYRSMNPEAADEQLADSDRAGSPLLGDREVPLEAEDEEVAEDLDADLYGTADVRKATEEGTAWNPPDSPTQEGFSDRSVSGENH